MISISKAIALAALLLLWGGGQTARSDDSEEDSVYVWTQSRSVFQELMKLVKKGDAGLVQKAGREKLNLDLRILKLQGLGVGMKVGSQWIDPSEVAQDADRTEPGTTPRQWRRYSIIGKIQFPYEITAPTILAPNLGIRLGIEAGWEQSVSATLPVKREESVPSRWFGEAAWHRLEDEWNTAGQIRIPKNPLKLFEAYPIGTELSWQGKMRVLSKVGLVASGMPVELSSEAYLLSEGSFERSVKLLRDPTGMWAQVTVRNVQVDEQGTRHSAGFGFTLFRAGKLDVGTHFEVIHFNSQQVKDGAISHTYRYDLNRESARSAFLRAIQGDLTASESHPDGVLFIRGSKENGSSTGTHFDFGYMNPGTSLDWSFLKSSLRVLPAGFARDISKTQRDREDWDREGNVTRTLTFEYLDRRDNHWLWGWLGDRTEDLKALSSLVRYHPTGGTQSSELNRVDFSFADESKSVSSQTVLRFKNIGRLADLPENCSGKKPRLKVMGQWQVDLKDSVFTDSVEELWMQAAEWLKLDSDERMLLTTPEGRHQWIRAHFHDVDERIEWMRSGSAEAIRKIHDYEQTQMIIELIQKLDRYFFRKLGDLRVSAEAQDRPKVAESIRDLLKSWGPDPMLWDFWAHISKGVKAQVQYQDSGCQQEWSVMGDSESIP